MRVSLVRLLVVMVAAFSVVILRAQAPSDSANRVFDAFAELSQPAQGTRWPEVSRAARERRRQSWQQLLARARALSTANLTAPERLSLAIIDRDLVERLEGEPFDSYIRPLSAFEDGFHNGIMDRLRCFPPGRRPTTRPSLRGLKTSQST